jgi:hypothetical protein
MWFEMRKERLDFAQRAPVVHVCEAELTAPRGLVFAAFAEPCGWKDWFPNVRAAAYASPAPHGVGTIRRARVGSTHWVEEMIAWDAPTRWAWTVARASVPFATAQVESFEFADAGRGTQVRWTLALEPRLLARLGAPVALRMIRRLFGEAMGNLSMYLQQQPSAERGTAEQ